MLTPVYVQIEPSDEAAHSQGNRGSIVRAWLRRLLPGKPPHIFGSEHVVVCVVDGKPVSERRFRLCLVCGRSDASAASGFKCKRAAMSQHQTTLSGAPLSPPPPRGS